MNFKITKYSVFLLAVMVCLTFSGNAISASNRGKAISKSLLPKELKNTTITDYYPESPSGDVAAIAAIEGTVVVERPDARQAYFAVVGDKLFEKDIIYTLKKSRCKFSLNTEDNVAMGENTRIVIKEVNDNQITASKSSLFGMLRGLAVFATVHTSRYFKQSLDVETATAVSGVRGSKFGVQIKTGGTKITSENPILVADASDNAFIHLARAQNDNTVTVVHGLEGQVEVKSKKDNSVQFLNPGQSIEATLAGLGKIFETPAKAIKQFMDSVDIKMQKAIRELDKQGKVLDKKMEKHTGTLDKWGKDLEKKFK
jgi:FecR protein